MNRLEKSFLALLILLVMGALSGVSAKVTSEEAAQLGKNLTPFGAEQAGNEDGTIPPWKGGITGPPSGVTHEKGDFYQNPFPDDKVLFTITSQNFDKYTDKLSEGLQHMFRKFSDFKIQVYPTRRTQAAPQTVYENTLQNATRVSLNESKLGYIGGCKGIPFPIPKEGAEVIWNHSVRWQGGSSIRPYNHLLVYSDGNILIGAGAETWEIYPYYLPNISPETFNGYAQKGIYLYTFPERRRGEVIVSRDPVDQPAQKRQVWQYLPGQRRVRRAPSVGYDTPNPASGGISGYDEGYMFYGPIDKFDWKIIGKKEMYIPYNNYDFDLAKRDELFTANYPNPNLVRFELHRVWILEAAQKERHQYSRQVLFIDEDSWTICVADRYDSRGELWRWSYGTCSNFYDLPAVVQTHQANFDDTTNFYFVQFTVNDLDKMWQCYKENKFPDGTFEPSNCRKLGRR